MVLLLALGALNSLNQAAGRYSHDPEVIQQAEQYYEEAIQQEEEEEKVKRKRRVQNQQEVICQHENIKECKKRQHEFQVTQQGSQNNHIIREVTRTCQQQNRQSIDLSQQEILYCNSQQIPVQDYEFEEKLRKGLAYATNLSYYFSKYSNDVEYNYKYENLSDYAIDVQNFKEKLIEIQALIDIEVKQRKKLSCSKVYKEIINEWESYQQAFIDLGIEKIEPFLGFIGEINNLINRKFTEGEKCNQKQDFRGIFLHGNSDTLYCVWHGSCQDYDWKSNFDLQQTTPHKGFLEEMDERYSLHAGFGQAFNLTLTQKQEIKEKSNENYQTFQEKLNSLLENKKTLFMSGHSLGAALATLSTVYFKELFKKQQRNDVKVKCWCYSAPRVFDKPTCDIINQKLKNDNEYEDIIRQNVFMDPVTQSFESPLDFKKSIRLYFNLVGLVLNEPVYKGFKRYMDNMQLISKSITGSFSQLFKKKRKSIPNGYFQTSFINKYIRKFLSSESLSILIETVIENSVSNFPIWYYLDGLIKGEHVKNFLGNKIEKIIPDLDYEKSFIIKDILRCLARLLDQTQDFDDKLENLMFQSIISLENENKDMYRQYVKEKQRNCFIKGVKNVGWSISSWFKSNETLRKEEQQERENSFKFGFYLLRNAFENFYSNTKLYQVWEQLLLEPTQASEYIWDYSDIGTCYLDVLKFENLLENKIFKTKQTKIYYTQIPRKLEKLQKYLVHYFAPLHYGNDSGAFNAKLTLQHTIQDLKEHGKTYQKENGNAEIFEKCQARNYELTTSKNAAPQEVNLTKHLGEERNSQEFVQKVWDEFSEYFYNNKFQLSRSIIPFNVSLQDQQQLKIQKEGVQRLQWLGINKLNKIEENIVKLGNYGRDLMIQCENQECPKKVTEMKVDKMNKGKSCFKCQQKSHNKNQIFLICQSCQVIYCQKCRP